MSRKLRGHVASRGIVGWYVSKAGLEFSSASLSDEEKDIVQAAIGRKKFRLWECFYNAQRIVRADKAAVLEYVEGYRFGQHGPIHHAWATIHGKVIDPTSSDGVAVDRDDEGRRCAVCSPSRSRCV
jgi:hypothetical protein